MGDNVNSQKNLIFLISRSLLALTIAFQRLFAVLSFHS
jgi:hypothetical protein